MLNIQVHKTGFVVDTLLGAEGMIAIWSLQRKWIFLYNRHELLSLILRNLDKL